MPSTVRVRTPKKELDPPHFEQEELDREEFDYLQYDFGADGEYVELLPRPCCLKTASFPVVHTCRTFQMVGLERMSTLFATDFNVNNGELGGRVINRYSCESGMLRTRSTNR